MRKLGQKRIREIASLQRRRYRQKLRQYVIEGVRSVEAALDAEVPLEEIVIATNVADDPRVARIRSRGRARLTVVPADVFAHLSNVESSQGVLAVAPLSEVPLGRVLEGTRVLALDAVQDPGNAGTLIRTAAWFGVDAVIAGPGTVDLFNPKTVRAAMGGMFDVMIAASGPLPSFLSQARQAGFACYGADLDGLDVREWIPAEQAVVVVGNEANGIAPDVRACLDACVTIRGTASGRAVESLNVAQAATVLLYEWARQSR